MLGDESFGFIPLSLLGNIIIFEQKKRKKDIKNMLKRYLDGKGISQVYVLKKINPACTGSGYLVQTDFNIKSNLIFI